MNIITYFIAYESLILALKGNCGVKMTVFQGLGLSTLFQFLTLCFAGGVFPDQPKGNRAARTGLKKIER